MNMDCGRAEELLSAYLDNEISTSDLIELENHLEKCDRCRNELDQYRKLKNSSSQIKLADPPGDSMEHYWVNISSRLSRGFGWIFFIAGSAILFVYAFYQFAVDTTINAFFKIIIAAIVIGLAMLFISVLIERLRDMKTDRYRGVQK